MQEESILGEITQTNPFEILETQIREQMKFEFMEIYNNNEEFYKKYIFFLLRLLKQKEDQIEHLEIILENKINLSN